MVKDNKYYDVLGVSRLDNLENDTRLNNLGVARCDRSAAEVGIQEGSTKIPPRCVVASSLTY